ncbi:uncharacterized protein LOC116804990 [Drosophila grimshawi]|uniref:uncharacterized protein LOC116804990 n=1 Tax=Drosophila grimshawi TaxID=7222 RepID=UPI000C86FDBB|nr:uncharacterized protein LOC116804990 [Drosophila grimshawi]
MTMTTRLLLLAFIIGSLYTLPAYASEQSPDYSYDDEDSSRSPGNLAKPTAATMVPYFEKDQEQGVVYVMPNETNVKLDCPVKNYDAVRHVILWYRDKTPVMNGIQPIIPIYSLDNQFVLNVPLANATGHNFSCYVMPANVRRLITIQLGTAPTPTSDSSSASSISWPRAVDCLILGVLSLIQQATARF